MPVSAGTLTDTVLQRIHDPGGVATSRIQIRDLLSRCQQLVNAGFNSVIKSVSFPTGPRQQVFTLTDIAGDVLKVKSVRSADGRDLSEIPFKRLQHISAKWFGASGPRWETFAKVGRTMIVVHPMKQSPSTAQLIYVPILPALTQDSDICALADDEVPTLTKLVEVLMLLRQRDFDAVKMTVQDVATALKIQMVDPEGERTGVDPQG